MQVRITTKFTQLMNVDSPIVVAPMYYACTPEMAIEASKAGAFPFVAAGFESSQKLQQDLQHMRKLLGVPEKDSIPVGVGFLGWILDITEVSDDPRIKVVLDERPKAVWFAFGINLGKYIKEVRKYDGERGEKTVIFVIVNSIEEAVKAVKDWNVDALVVQGIEAGGHGAANGPALFDLLQSVLKAVPSNGSTTILAAGGISTGAQIAALLTMGADAVVMGTRFLFTKECMYSDDMKAVLVNAEGPQATMRSYLFDEVNRTAMWPEGINGRAIANELVSDYEEGLGLEERLKRSEESKKQGERTRLVIWAGVGVGQVNEVKLIRDVIKELHEEMVDTLKRVPKIVHL